MPSIYLSVDGSERPVRFDRLIMAGYTGRNQEEVQAHIEELKAHGIPAPDHTPTLYPCSPQLLTSADEIWVLGGDTGGEAEFAIVPDGNDLLIGVASDHTDRKLEETNIPLAKQVCAKVVSSQAWRLSDIRPHWDQLVLRSWIGESGADELYQEGELARMMTPDDILATVGEHEKESSDARVVFSGTMPVLSGGFKFAPVFTVELEDPVRGQRLRHSYRTHVMDYLT